MTNTILRSARLCAITEMVTAGNRLADIGTDHGYLPIGLLQMQRIPSAIAMDIRSGPLGQARMNRDRAGLTDRMELRLSDGLHELKEWEADTIVISGMGGILIRDILNSGEPQARTARELILSPQSDIPLVRTWLRVHGFVIVDESVVPDGGKYYTVIKAVPSGDGSSKERAETFQDRYGPVLLKKRQEAFLDMLQKQAERNQDILLRLRDAEKSPEIREKIQKRSRQQEELLQILQDDRRE